LNRKVAKTATEIATLLGRLIDLEDQKTVPASNLEAYKLEVEEALRAKLRLLDAVRTKRQQRARSRNEEPKGIGRWLLLYRPESFDGLFVQLTYYIAAFFVLDIAILGVAAFTGLDIAIEGVATFPDLDRGTILALLIVVLLCVATALYARNISLRMKRLGNAIRLGTMRSPNSDLGWLRRNLLIFKRGDGLGGIRFWYYLLLILAVFGPISQHQKRHYPWSEEILIGAFYLAFAQVVKVHALLRRGSLKMRDETRHEEVRTAESTPD
jgi:hypothetical protein